MKHWFKDQHFKSLLKNSSYLAASKAVAAVAAVATLAFAGRGLGLELFGMLVLIHSYVQAAAGIAKFQSWQLVVRYGGQALAGGDQPMFKTATGFAFALDAVSGVIGVVAAIALLPLLGGWFGIDERYIAITAFYCILVATMGAATPVGVLRSLDRFDLISWQGTSYPIARAILCGAAWLTSAPFETYVLIWFATTLGGELFLWFLAWRELRRRDLLRGIRPTLKPEGLNRPWPFAIQTNLTASLMAAWGPIVRLVIGGLLGEASAGLYRVASSLADSAQKPADLLAKAYYPEVVRMDLRTKKPWKLMLRGTVLAGGVGLIALLVMLIAGRPLLEGLFGTGFGAAYPVLVVLMLVPVLGILSFPLPPMLYALDRPDGPLKARLLGTIAFFLLVAPLAQRFELLGAAAAFVIGNAVMVAALAWQVRREHHRVRSA